MSTEIKDSVRQGLSERIKDGLPGLTKAAHEMVVDDILNSIETNESVKAALMLSGEGHDKSASFFKIPFGVGQGFSKGVGEAGGKVAVGLLSAGVLHNFLKHRKNEERFSQYADFQHTLATVVARNERLSSENADKIYDMGNSIFKFAPTVATDANVLETVLDNAVQYNGLDAATVRSLQELEERYHKLKDVAPSKDYMLG